MSLFVISRSLILLLYPFIKSWKLIIIFEPGAKPHYRGALLIIFLAFTIP